MARPKGVKSYRSGKSATDHKLVDILVGPFNDRRAVCGCSWVSAWWSEARMATDEWRLHAGVEDE